MSSLDLKTFAEPGRQVESGRVLVLRLCLVGGCQVDVTTGQERGHMEFLSIQRDGSPVYAEFLPIQKDGLPVYTGFWKRFGASLVDSFVLFPVGMIFLLLEGISIWSAIVVTVASGIFFTAYIICFHYRYGATLGKMVTGIKVTLPNGSPIEFKEALLRSCVELALSVTTTVARLSALINADAEQYQSLDWIGREKYVLSLVPAWHEFVEPIYWYWFWSEVVVLLFNERKRAIHDLIAGTVVIHKRFSK